MDRRKFLSVAGAVAVGAAVSDIPAGAKSVAPVKHSNRVAKGHFSLTQLASVTDTIGNSYILKTSKGSVIVMDGGKKTEVDKFRKHIEEAGNKVKAWFISHPHSDHHGVLNEILKNPKGMEIETIYHSRFPKDLINSEPSTRDAYELYGRLSDIKDINVVDLHRTGKVIDIDGVKITVLGVTNPEITTNPYNNSSLILRVEDDSKSVVFLGDAGKECGDKVLAAYPELLNCDYLQVAHHGQSGCDERFYKTIKFKACLWPTPSWVWDPSKRPDLTFLNTMDTRRWMDEIGITEHHVTCLEGDFTLE